MISLLSNLLFFLYIESPAEAFYTASSVKNSLLTSKEWMAIRTDINLQKRLDAECLKAISTGTTYCGLNIIWMYSFFHSNSQGYLPIHHSYTITEYINSEACVQFNSNGCGHDCTRKALFRQDGSPYRPPTTHYRFSYSIIWNTFLGIFMPEKPF